MDSSRHPRFGAALVVVGIVAVVTGAVPLGLNVARAVMGQAAAPPADFVQHGVEKAGLTREWAMLSSAMGTQAPTPALGAGNGEDGSATPRTGNSTTKVAPSPGWLTT